jgi:hypothetical protein
VSFGDKNLVLQTGRRGRDIFADQVERDVAQSNSSKNTANEQQRKDFEAALAQHQKQIEALTAGLQKVSAQLEAGGAAPQTVVENH